MLFSQQHLLYLRKTFSYQFQYYLKFHLITLCCSYDCDDEFGVATQIRIDDQDVFLVRGQLYTKELHHIFSYRFRFLNLSPFHRAFGFSYID